MKFKHYMLMFGSVLLLWVLCWCLSIRFIDSFTERGQFGDMFGAVNALFSGLAFGGIILTILLQKEELKLQRQELKLQRTEMQETRKEFIEQNKNLRIQRFENTFFNMISIHHELVEGLKSSDRNHLGRQTFMEIINIWNSSLFQEKILDYEPSFFPKYTKSFRDYFSGGQLYSYSHYLQSLKSLYNLIKLSELVPTEEEKEYYFGILKSYISYPERRFLFYFIILGETNDSTIGTLREMENDLMVIGTVSGNELLKPSHLQLLGQLKAK
jgi:hypothetical protein